MLTFRPDRRIARAINADLRTVLEDYGVKISRASRVAELQRLKREVARKLIRATNMLRDPDSLFWPIALDDYVGQLLALHPDKAPEIDYLLAHAINNANDVEFTERMMDFLCWLEHQ